MACGPLPWQLSGCVDQAAKSVAGDAFEAIATSFGHAAADATGWLWNQLGTASAVHLGGNGFSSLLSIVATIAVTVGLGLFVLQVIQSVLRREPGGLARAVKGLLIAFVAGGAAAGVVNVLLAAVDALCNGVVHVAVGTNPSGLGQLVLGTAGTATLTGLVSGAGGAAGVLLLSLAILVAVVIVYAALVVRKVLIVVAAVFAPLAFAGSLADITVAWTRRWIETTVALIAAKLILILIFVTGYFMLVKGAGQAGSGVTQEITQLVSGVIILTLAGFAPWLALKVVHFTGEHAHQLHTLAATSTGGAVVAGRMGQKMLPLAQRATSALSTGSGAAQSAAGESSRAPSKPSSGGNTGPDRPDPPHGGPSPSNPEPPSTPPRGRPANPPAAAPTETDGVGAGAAL